MNMRMILGVIAAAIALSGCVSGPKVDNASVATLDLNRYLGEWYEIARFDHSTFSRSATAWLRHGQDHLGAARQR